MVQREEKMIKTRSVQVTKSWIIYTDWRSFTCKPRPTLAHVSRRVLKADLPVRLPVQIPVGPLGTLETLAVVLAGTPGTLVNVNLTVGSFKTWRMKVQSSFLKLKSGAALL